MGGTTAAARNVISANLWGIRLDGSTATGNLIEGNDIGTDSSGTAALGNEINGIIISNNASGNTIGGTVSGQEATRLPSTWRRAFRSSREPATRSFRTRSFPMAISESTWLPPATLRAA